MIPTYDVILAILQTDPDAAMRQLHSGITDAQAAALLIDAMHRAPSERSRDLMFSNAMAQVGVYTDGIEAFDRGTENMLRDMGNRDAAQHVAQRMAQDSQRTPIPATPERILALRDVAAKASLTQGLTDRMRSRDQREYGDRTATPRNERLTHAVDDDRDRRSALRAALATAKADDTVRVREAPTLRDAVADSFDAHADIAEQADPLLDDSLRAMSNAV